MICLTQNYSSNCAGTNCHKCGALKQSKSNLLGDSEFLTHCTETVNVRLVLVCSGGPGRESIACCFHLVVS